MVDVNVTRRDFIRSGAVATVGAALGLTPTYTVRAGNPEKADTKPILNYNPQMEYRRCGKTELMISAVCLGGHWKRIDKVVGRAEKGKGWIGLGAGSPEFDKNRHNVVSRCIERGINYIDACVSRRCWPTARRSKAAATRCTWATPGTRPRCGPWAPSGPRPPRPASRNRRAGSRRNSKTASITA